KFELANRRKFASIQHLATAGIS
ncbi:unnamed protein product, partial [Oikopleura dioica]